MTAEQKQWLDQHRREGYQPCGIVGVSSLEGKHLQGGVDGWDGTLWIGPSGEQRIGLRETPDDILVGRRRGPQYSSIPTTPLR